jgi:hypothetical protein
LSGARAGDGELGVFRCDELETAGDVERRSLDDGVRQLGGPCASVRPMNAAWRRGATRDRAPANHGKATNSRAPGSTVIAPRELVVRSPRE